MLMAKDLNSPGKEMMSATMSLVVIGSGKRKRRTGRQVYNLSRRQFYLFTKESKVINSSFLVPFRNKPISGRFQQTAGRKVWAYSLTQYSFSKSQTHKINEFLIIRSNYQTLFDFENKNGFSISSLNTHVWCIVCFKDLINMWV